MLTRTELAWLRQAAEAGFHATPATTLQLLDIIDASPPVSPLQVAMHRGGWDAERLAIALGCTPGHVRAVLAGRRRFGPERRAALAELVGWEDSATEPEGLVAQDPLRLLGDLVSGARMALGLPPTCPPVVVIEAVARTLGRALLDLHVPPAPTPRPVDTLPLPFDAAG